MKTFKKKPRKQLEKFSAIFMQLGLVLSLFIAFVTLEHESEKEIGYFEPVGDDYIESVFVFTKPKIIKKVEKKTIVPKKKEVVKEIIEPKVVKNNTDIETVIATKKEPKKEVNVLPKKEEPKGVETTMSIKNVQKTPVFKGCEGLSEIENRKCFERKIQQHVQRYFDSELAQDVGLSSGKYKIYTQFVIDKNGEVTDVKIRAPHKKLEKETNKVVTKIPKFTPGKQNDRAVKVKYTLPITFKVE